MNNPATDQPQYHLPCYDIRQTYEWNYNQAPGVVAVDIPDVLDINGNWAFCGRPIESPLGMPAGPLLNGRWLLYYAALGFDVLTYKTVRSSARSCYPLPNLLPVNTPQLRGNETNLPAESQMNGSWAVSFGMPSAAPDVWRKDVAATRTRLAAHKLMVVSVVGSIQPGWTIDELADDYAVCARWAIESGADAVETNFSCPNVTTCDGQLYQQTQDAAIVAERVRTAIGSDAIYLAKIGHTPGNDLAKELLNAIGEHVNGLAMTNSIAATVVMPDDQLAFEGQRRGICGEATREGSTQQVRLFRQLIDQQKLNIDIVGIGGIESADDVIQYLDAGANSVQLASAAMVDPSVAVRIRHDWPI